VGERAGDVDVYWYRWAPCVNQNEEFAEEVQRVIAAPAEEWRVYEWASPAMLARSSRSWVCWERREGASRMLLNGLFLVAVDLDRERILDLLHDTGVDRRERERAGFEHQARGPIHAERLRLVELDRQVPGFEQALGFLSVWSTAALALDRLAHFEDPSSRDRGRRIVDERLPHSRALSIVKRVGTMEMFADAFDVARSSSASRESSTAAQERRERTELAGYMAGTVAPAIEQASAWGDGDAAHPLHALLSPLALFSTERDEGEIRQERDERAAQVTAQTTLAVLLVLTAVQLARLSSLGLVVLAGSLALIVGACRGILALTRRAARVEAHRKVLRANLAEPGTRELPLGRCIRQVDRAGTVVVVGKRMGAVDYACAFSIWSELLVRHGQASLTVDPELACAGCAIVVGGPLVTPRGYLPMPTCELRPLASIVEGWAYRVAASNLIRDRDDEAVGCLSVAQDSERVLYVSGFRNARLATEQLLRHMHQSTDLLDRAWCLYDEH
jgi:hypothetical protein